MPSESGDVAVYWTISRINGMPPRLKVRAHRRIRVNDLHSDALSQRSLRLWRQLHRERRPDERLIVRVWRDGRTIAGWNANTTFPHASLELAARLARHDAAVTT